MAEVDPARRVAYDVLRAVASRDSYANLVLPGLLRQSGLSARDRGFAAELAYGALRWQGSLDHVIASCASRPVAAIDAPLLDVVRLGAYQLLRLRVPSHAAVTTSVDLARSIGGEGAARFANAVLRRVAERDGELGAPAFAADPVGHLAVEHAHPRWVVEAFRDALGGDFAETATLLAADDRPAVHLVARPGRITREELLAECAATGLDAAPGPWSPYAVRLGGGDPGQLPAVREQRAAVQDEGSQLCALAVDRLLPAGPATVADVCAGPGGKAALLEGLLAARGGALVAGELRTHRVGLVRNALDRSLVVQADGTRPPWRAGAFDAVLLDAPCTGLGALRRRPESRWRRQPEDVHRLATLQRDLITASLPAVRTGGLLVYVVCSPHRREGVDLVERTLTGRSDVTAVDVRAALPGVPDLGDGPWVQLWPHRQGTDAMFLSAVRRTS